MVVKPVGAGIILIIAGLAFLETSSFASKLGWAFIAGGAFAIIAGLGSAAY